MSSGHENLNKMHLNQTDVIKNDIHMEKLNQWSVALTSEKQSRIEYGRHSFFSILVVSTVWLSEKTIVHFLILLFVDLFLARCPPRRFHHLPFPHPCLRLVSPESTPPNTPSPSGPVSFFHFGSSFCPFSPSHFRPGRDFSFKTGGAKKTQRRPSREAIFLLFGAR
jgi:hypothetical protein